MVKQDVLLKLFLMSSDGAGGLETPPNIAIPKCACFKQLLLEAEVFLAW